MTPATRAVDPCGLEIYTDGGCDPNPGPGGWGAILTWGDQTKELSGAAPQTTNNRMELTAAIVALQSLNRPCRIAMYTDSQYLRRGITQWVRGWQSRGWKKANGRPVENSDLWQALVEATAQHDIQWHWLKGHAGHPLNERADALATAARRHLLQSSPCATGEQQPALSTAEADYVIYTRGCALGSPGPAGYAAIVCSADGPEQTLSGGETRATNNAMEIMAAVAALESLPSGSQVVMRTPAKYLIQGASEWLPQWRQQGWRTKAGKPVSNQALWERLDRAINRHQIAWLHLDTPLPEAARASRLARQEARRLKR